MDKSQWAPGSLFSGIPEEGDDYFKNREREKIAMENAQRLYEDDLRESRANKQDLMIAVEQFEPFLNKLSNKLYTEGKDLMFKEIVSDIFYESVYLDDDYKSQYRKSIKKEMCDYIDSRGGFLMLEAACKKNKDNKFLSKMKNGIEKVASKASLKKVKKLREGCEGQNKGAKAKEAMSSSSGFVFEFDKETMEEYESMRDGLSEEEVTKLIKNKVLDVIDEEGKHQREMETFDEEIKEVGDELSETENKAFKESTSIDIHNNSQTDYTLFESLLYSSMNEIVVESTMDEINMDEALGEAIAKYTLLETLNTMNLESFSRLEVEKICKDLINEKKNTKA